MVARAGTPKPPRVETNPNVDTVPSGAASAPALPLPPSEPQRLPIGEARDAVYYYPSTWKEDLPVVVMLHGMCALPEYECGAFRAGTTHMAWLLCPAGPTPCQGGGAMWSGPDSRLREVVRRAIEALRHRHPSASAERLALVGYSLGASAAQRLVARERAGFARIMFLNSGTVTYAEPLRQAGVTRVALVAGDRDMSTSKLKASARRLREGKMSARFFSLENTGHFFDPTSEERLVAPLNWLLEDF